MNTVQCNDREKELYASHQLTDSASTWRSNYEYHYMAEFVEQFHKAHIPIGIMAQKRMEFLNLKQRNMCVADYMQQFTYLSRYALDDVNTETKKVEAFFNGMQDSLKFHLSGFKFATLHELVDDAIQKEETRTNLEDSRKRYQKQQGGVVQRVTQGRMLTKMSV